MIPPIAKPKRSRHLREVPFDGDCLAKGLSTVVEETEEPLRLELGGDGTERSGGSQPPSRWRKRLRSCGLGDREAGEDSSAVSSNDEEMPTTGRARILQRRGRAPVRELEKKTKACQQRPDN